MPNIENLEERMEKLSRNLGVTRWAIILLSGVVGLLLWAVLFRGNPEEVRAQRFIVEEADGTERGFLGIGAHSVPEFKLGGGSDASNPLVEISARKEDGGRMVLRGAENKWISFKPDGPAGGIYLGENPEGLLNPPPSTTLGYGNLHLGTKYGRTHYHGPTEFRSRRDKEASDREAWMIDRQEALYVADLMLKESREVRESVESTLTPPLPGIGEGAKVLAIDGVPVNGETLPTLLHSELWELMDAGKYGKGARLSIKIERDGKPVMLEYRILGSE